MSDANDSGAGAAREQEPLRLRDALRRARIEAADRSAVIIDLRDAELARLDILNEALDPVFRQIPDGIDLFDRGISQGETPRLWIDMVAHVVMGRDKRIYRFVQDTRHGRVVLSEAHAVPEIVDAVTTYIARRMIERDQALATRSSSAVDQTAVSAASNESPALDAAVSQASTASVASSAQSLRPVKPARSGVLPFMMGMAVGAAFLVVVLIVASRGG